MDRAADTGGGLVDLPWLGRTLDIAGVGCKSATLTIWSAANAGVFFERLEPGTPDILKAHATLVLFEVIVFLCSVGPSQIPRGPRLFRDWLVLPSTDPTTVPKGPRCFSIDCSPDPSTVPNGPKCFTIELY